MRQLKFRAWNEVKKEWLFGYELLGGFSLVGEVVMLGELGSIPLQELNNIEFMQFTGFRDKNGFEAYEGDVYHCGYEYSNGTHKYGDRNVIKDIRDFKPEDEFTIIGNIYQNPELLAPIK